MKKEVFSYVIRGKNRDIFITLLILFLVLFVYLVFAILPELHSVDGYIFINDNGLQAPVDTIVTLNATETGSFVKTQTYGPPGSTGYYSTDELNATDGEFVLVIAFNSTYYGLSNVSLLPNPSVTEVNVTLNISRDPETNVTITTPSNGSIFYLDDTPFVNTTIMMLGGNGVNCNASLNFSNGSIFGLVDGENLTVELGDLALGEYSSASWNLDPVVTGRTNITVSAFCENSGVNLEDLYSFTVYDIQVKSGIPTLHSVEGYVYMADGITQMPVGTEVIINATESQNVIITQTSGPPGYTGYYSTAELNATDGEYIIVTAQNTTDKGVNSSFLLDSPSITYIDVIINESRNAIPNMSNVLVEDDIDSPANEIDLISNSTKHVTCTADVSDYDGYDDLVSAIAVFFDSSVATPTSPLDNNSYYFNDSCSLINCVGLACEVECGFDIWYYANNNSDESWSCNITVTDSFGVNATGGDMTSINVLLSIDVNPALISYGFMVPNNVSDEIEINITNLGNTNMNLNVSAYGETFLDGLAMNCTDGNSIGVEHEKYNFTESNNIPLDFLEMDNLYTNLTAEGYIAELNLPQHQNDSADLITDATNSTYWRLYIPPGIANEASCTGYILISGVAN